MRQLDGHYRCGRGGACGASIFKHADWLYHANQTISVSHENYLCPPFYCIGVIGLQLKERASLSTANNQNLISSLLIYSFFFSPATLQSRSSSQSNPRFEVYRSLPP
jgi:hypothetical protein